MYIPGGSSDSDWPSSIRRRVGVWCSSRIEIAGGGHSGDERRHSSSAPTFSSLSNDGGSDPMFAYQHAFAQTLVVQR